MMLPVNPNSEVDKRITAFSRRIKLKTYADGSYLVEVSEYNCWGKLKNRVKYREMPGPDVLKMGKKSHLTLELMQRGCCPPQLASQMLGDEDSPGAKGDAIEEAYKLHKRGYLGGVG
jgi:hypothetical protein